MSENPPPNPPNPDQPAPQRPQVRVPDHLAQGVYATAMIIPHAREEFVLDFLASHAQPPRMIARVVLTPSHIKRLAAAIRENINLYEKNHGPIPAAARQQMARTIQNKDFYANIAVPERVLGGVYASSVIIRHSREEFILDFLTSFPPSPIINARVLISPPHILRVANALEARLRQYEDQGGKIPEPPSEPPPPPGAPPKPDDPSAPPDSPEGGGPRFKII